MTGPRPSVAGVYDYLLGGTDHSPADQAAGDQIMAALPEAGLGVRAQRDVLRRAVRYLATEAGIGAGVGAGVGQFADLGSGLPTADNVHQIAQRHRPGARVVYIDHDPAVVAQAHRLLAADETTVAVAGDLRDPAAVLADPAVAGHLDWDQPVALLMCGILHYVPDDEHPAELTAAWYRALAPGSYVFIHHLLTSEDPAAAGLQAAMAQALGPVQFRTRAEVEGLFGGLELIEPGVVPVPQWHPDPDTPSERDHPALGLACAGLAVVR
jgi:O-methyltransferase involved in polyketide biosynthesis